ncbi:DUF6868 family protein [Polaromonas sp. SM01]|uniref:DUF6868 family protein n=1 Tax=Polaromonas sp. SM01 TaxID=3085630 RepID=UPI002980B593|nr:hypothetical protein [Polaromonas sp. SM01]MDW5441589.1 hypothetical protein [Polaromonas sp. SM01]
MTIKLAGDFVLWCAVINYVVLLAWFVAFRSAHAWMYGLHSRWFQMSEERFDRVHYGCMALYKVGILLFNVAPYLALRMLGSHGS